MMKEIKAGTGADLVRVSGCEDWYYALKAPYGDLYEAEELFHLGRLPEGGLYLIRYPEGTVYEPVISKAGVCFGAPVYEAGMICFPEIDFGNSRILIRGFCIETGETETLADMPLSDAEDCYNLRLFGSPPVLSRQPNDGTLDIIWPQKKKIRIGSTESFFARRGEHLYFEAWFEDPDYRTETVVRSLETGEVVCRADGSCYEMPNGDLWHLK